MKADIVVLTASGQPALIADVKAKKNASAQWASRYCRDKLAHFPRSAARFLLLATPERFYFWKDGLRQPDRVEPDFELDSSAILAKYRQTNRDIWAWPSEFALEFVVSDWLRALTYADENDPTIPNWVLKSGLLSALRGGRVTFEADV